ncbi:aldo/keto reductase family protein [Paenibacillus apiarius]|uniref:aldo/keto reductase family protein n=1 Tax=Paenibacillus apiarius TaxID=46240 RepID=UPI003B3B5FD0
MQYRRLGTCGLKVSEISLGSWLTYGGSIDQDQAEAIIDQAYELGINFFDTANVYHEGAAEEIIGKALAKYERSSYVLATKVYFEMGEGPNDRGLSRKHIIEQCEASLKRLGTDYIDLYQCHRYDSEAPLEETLRALDDLVTQGKVLYVGVSSWEANHIADAVHTARQCNLDRIVSNQPHYNMLDRSIEKDVLPLCEQEGIGQVVYCPLAQGVLTGKYKPGAPAPEGTRASDASTNMFMESFMQDHYLRKVKRLHSIADRNGISMPQLALAWILRYGIISSCIIGATRPEQVIENSKASGVKLSPKDLKEIELILKEET